MKVCMVAYTFYESDNRVRRYAESLARRGDQVEVIALSHEKAASPDSELNGVRVFQIQSRQVNESHALVYLFRVLKFLVKSAIFLTRRHLRSRYHVIHVHSVPDFEVFAALVPKLLGAKIILDIHDIVPEFYAGKFHGNKVTLAYRMLVAVERLCCAFSDHVIISNHLWADKLTQRSVEKHKCTTLLNYPDPYIFTRRHGSRRKRAPFTFIYPGTLNWHQGLDIAIRAMAILKPSAPEAQFHIYGRGPERDRLAALTESLNITDTVKFLGTLPMERIAEKMETADAGVVPKRADGFGNEAFSTKIFEFMALGVPVVVSRTRIDQYYFNDSLVLFFEPGDPEDLADKMLLCLRNEQARRHLAQNASSFIQVHSWENKKHLYFNLVDSLAGAA